MDLKVKKGTQNFKRGPKSPKRSPWGPGDPFKNSGIVVAEATQRLLTTRGGRRSRGEYLSKKI